MWDLPSPTSITYFWNFGSTLGICLGIQITTGLLLTLHYISFSEQRFRSIAMIIQEIWSGWVIRLIHINGASAFFLIIYIHLFRGIYFFRPLHKKVWLRGVTIIIVLMAISFLGYVLPWGQMSYWAVAVITNLISVVPLVGDEIVNWIWGGFSVDTPTLIRFYSFHYLLPFILSVLVIAHLTFLHKEGSRTNLGVNRNIEKIQFHPYFSVKDLFFIGIITALRLSVSIYFPYILGDTINNVPANPIQTPHHIQPEWYFLTSYAILRALPRKVAGVLALLFSVSIFYILPIYKSSASINFSKFRLLFFWTFIFSFLFLTLIGASEAKEPYIIIRKMASITYFSSILLINL